MDSAQQAALSDSDPELKSNLVDIPSNKRYYDPNQLLSEYNVLTESTIRQMHRFETLPVNLSSSTILSAFGVDMRENEIIKAIKWSAHLDPIFANNLERDPSISWQYFGSSSGFLRRYPRSQWPSEGSKSEINEFRTEDWFIQAASSPKDIVSYLSFYFNYQKISFSRTNN